MSPELSPRLQKLLDTEACAPVFGRVFERAIRIAKRLRTLGIAAVLLTLSTIAVPMPMSPQSARAWGIAGLVTVALGTVLHRFFLSRIGPEAKQQALSQILSWSDQISELEETNLALKPKERAAAVAHVRSFVTERFLGYRFRSYLDSEGGEMWVPDLPLPPAARAMLVKTRDHMPTYSAANWTVAAPWLILAYFLVWTSLFLLIWAASPEPCDIGEPVCVGALQGFGTSPSIGDFIFLVLNASASNMPPDLTPRSGLAHLVFAGSFVSAIGILAITATAIWGRLKRQTEHNAFH